MNNISIPTKKFFLSFINKFNKILSNKFNYLNRENLSQFSKSLIYDRRFVITLIISLSSVFAHLSTPAFYQDRWVLEKIKTQLENEFNLKFILPQTVDYSMFPVPSFHLKDVKLNDGKKELGKIEKVVLHLSFNKFLNKEKINIQNIHVKNSKFDIYYKDIKNMINFFKKEINDKKLYIHNSNIFFKNNNDEVYSILTIDKSQSIFDKEYSNNILEIKGNVFNIPISLIFFNYPKSKELNFELELENIGKKIKTNLNYFNNTIISDIDFIGGSTNYLSKLELVDNKIYLYSEKKINQKYLYLADIELDPFYTNLKINLDTLDIFDLIKNDSLFMNLISSNLINNKNLNYEVRLHSDNLKNHRLLQDLVMNLNFKESKLDFDNSRITFDENVYISLKNTEFISNMNDFYFKGDLNFKIENSEELYKFFQTNKNYRKKIKEINLSLKINLHDNSYLIEKISIDNETNDKIQNIINYYNKNKVENLRRIEIKNLFNEIISNL